MSTRVTRFVVQALIATGAALLAIAPAQATVWVGKWDPRYGSPFTTDDGFDYDLGWAGEVKVDAPCLAPLGGGIVTNLDACDGGATVESLIVTLYAYPNLTPVYNTLTFDPGSLVIDQLEYDAAGKLTGISTSGLSNFVFDSAELAAPIGAGTNAYFAVQFVLGGLPCLFCGAEEFFDGDPLPLDPSGYSGPVLFASGDAGCADGIGEACDELFRNSTAEGDRPVINFTPEPGSLALLALGLLAAGAASRRRADRG